MDLLSREQRIKKYRKYIQDTWDAKYIDFIKTHIDKPFNWRNISLSTNLTLTVITEFADKLIWFFTHVLLSE